MRSSCRGSSILRPPEACGAAPSDASESKPMKGSGKSKSDIPKTAAAHGLPPWTLHPAEKRAAAAALVLSLIARWQNLLPGYSADDYGHLIAPQHFSFDFSLSQGRPLVPLLLDWLGMFGLHPAEAMTVSTFSLILALLFAGVAVCRLMGISERPLECAAVMSLLAVHPYQAEIFTFRTASILAAIPLILAFAALLLPRRQTLDWAVAILIMAVAVSIYQTVVHYVAVAIALSFCIRALREDAGKAWAYARPLAIVLALGIVLYMAALKALLLATGVAMNPRGSLIGPEDLLYRAAQVKALLERIFFRTDPVMPAAPKFLLLAVLVLTVFAVAAGRPAESAKRRLALATAGIGLGIACCLGLNLVLRDWWPSPRLLSQLGLFWGGVLALGLISAGPGLRPVLIGLGAFAVFSSVGLSVRVAAEQLRLNRRDMTQAAQIIAEVDRLPGAERLQGICIHGGSPFYPAGFRTAFFDLNVSALSVSWARTWLLNEVSGRNYVPPDDGTAARAAQFCAGAPRWPRRDSLTQIGNYAVVCLPDP